MRARLAADLAAMGYEPLEFAQDPPIASTSSLAVWVIPKDAQPSVAIDEIRPWLVAGAQRRAVIVTWHAGAVREALHADAHRTAVCPAPMRTWQIVEAVRGVVSR